jgi:acetyl esterase/lipase
MSPDARKVLSELSAWAAAGGWAPALHAYGSDPEERAELLLPAGHGPHPVAVLVHGGFWRAEFTRALMAALALDLQRRGWASWNVEYRRVGSGGGAAEAMADVRAAIGALEQLAEPLDLERIVVIGHSAGGQLALCCAPGTGAALVVSLAGVCDLASTAHQRLGDGAAIEFLGGAPESCPALYAQADPIARLPSGVETLLVHGQLDDRVPVEQSRRYHAAAAGAGDRCRLLELPGTGHFELIDPRSDAWRRTAAMIERGPEPV